MDGPGGHHPEWGNTFTKELTQYVLTDKWTLAPKLRTPKIQLAKHKKTKKKEDLSSVEGHLGSFHLLAIINKAAMNIVEHVSFLPVGTSSGYMPRRGIAGSSGSTMSNFLRNCQTDFQSGCTSWVWLFPAFYSSWVNLLHNHSGNQSGGSSEIWT